LYHEHLVHPLLNALAHKREKRVLIVGGAEGATAREVLKWPADQVAHVDWVDLDGGLVSLCRRYLSWANDDVYNDPRLHFHASDIRLFWASNTFLYDVIILDLPDPDVVMAAETADDEYPLYGQRFWEVVASRLSTGGGVVTHCGAIAAGAAGEKRRPGLTWNIRCAERVGLMGGESYHVFIPSFHSEWGFWMSVAAAPFHSTFPSEKCLVMSSVEAQKAAFYWAPYWTSPFLGL
jgi:spermidine synthase